MKKETREQKIDIGMRGKPYRYRVKKIISGDYAELEIYPVYGNGRTMPKRERGNQTADAQKKINDRNRVKNFYRKLNANFGKHDLVLHVTYSGDAPDEQRVKRDVTNYIRRIKRYRKKIGLPEMKYAYVTESADGDKNPTRIHAHIVMTGGGDGWQAAAQYRAKMEMMWTCGDYANADFLQPKPDSNGLEPLARYMLKNRGTIKRIACSKNMKQPKIRTSDTVVTKRRAERAATDHAKTVELCEKICAGYECQDTEIRENEFVRGVSISAKLAKKRRRE